MKSRNTALKHGVPQNVTEMTGGAYGVQTMLYSCEFSTSCKMLALASF